MATLTMSQTWCSGTYSVSHTLVSNGRTARITCSMHLWRNDGGRSWNDSASNNFYITINGNRSNKTITSISGTTGVTVSHTVDVGLDNNGQCSVGVSVGGSISGSTFAITGNNSTTYRVTNGSKASWTVSYNANGGTGAPANQTKVYNTALTLSTTEPTKPGYLFRGWATSQDAAEAIYQPGDTYTTNAALTLYAVWLIAEKIGLKITPKDLTIPAPSGFGVHNIPTLNLPFSVDYTSDNYTIDFYYKVCYVDNASGIVNDINKNSLGITHGPMNARDIGEGGGEDDSFQIPLTPELIKQSILNCGSESKVSFYVITSMVNDSFSDELTLSQVIDINILNFRFLKLDLKILFKSSKTIVAGMCDIFYAPSYGSIDSFINITKITKIGETDNDDIDNGTSILSSSYDSEIDDNAVSEYSSENINGKGTFYVNGQSTQDKKSIIIKVEADDGISSYTVTGRVGTYANQDVLIYSDDHVEAVEFIESSEYSGFEVGGRILSEEFIETDEGVFIGGKFYCKELVEL